jgi:deoxyribodipyrimidine photo-lyase
MTFHLDFATILERIDRIDPIAYSKTRNYINGDITYLSPYISRGFISTKQILATVLAKGYPPNAIEHFIQELAWRDYWQYTWLQKGDAIHNDLLSPQTDVQQTGIPNTIIHASTGITAIDTGIIDLYNTGYMHNHIRMYVASLCCNIAKCSWKEPAQWMYYNLLDGDIASNQLSWQWICGTNSSKKYVANQENINTFAHTNQKHTFLDVTYEILNQMPIPEVLRNTVHPLLQTELPSNSTLKIDSNKKTALYTYYNLDPLWLKQENLNRILILEPSMFEKYPISKNCIDFVLNLGKENIPHLQVFVGEFNELQGIHENTFEYKEHPLNSHFIGNVTPRDFICSDIKGEFTSFFSYWKKVKNERF